MYCKYIKALKLSPSNQIVVKIKANTNFYRNKMGLFAFWVLR